MSHQRVTIFERYPDIPGHVGKTTVRSGVRRAVTADGRYWEVRPRRLFARWRWLPVRGMFVHLREVAQ